MHHVGIIIAAAFIYDHIARTTGVLPHAAGLAISLARTTGSHPELIEALDRLAAQMIEREPGFGSECGYCGTELDADGACEECDAEPNGGGMSDYEERMIERRQMGLTN